MADLPTKKSPLIFFVLVYGLSIPFWIIETIIDVKGLPLDIPITDIFAAFAPLTAASILVHKEEGHMGIKKLFGRIFDFSKITRRIWYIPIIFLPFVFYFLIYLTIYFSGLSLPGKWIVSFSSIPVFVGIFLLGAVVEETGYMGYAIDPMQEQFGAFWASILMGITWAVWHYPSIIQQGHNLTWIA